MILLSMMMHVWLFGQCVSHLDQLHKINDSFLILFSLRNILFIIFDSLSSFRGVILNMFLLWNESRRFPDFSLAFCHDNLVVSKIHVFWRNRFLTMIFLWKGVLLLSGNFVEVFFQFPLLFLQIIFLLELFVLSTKIKEEILNSQHLIEDFSNFWFVFAL